MLTWITWKGSSFISLINSLNWKALYIIAIINETSFLIVFGFLLVETVGYMCIICDLQPACYVICCQVCQVNRVLSPLSCLSQHKLKQVGSNPKHPNETTALWYTYKYVSFLHKIYPYKWKIFFMELWFKCLVIYLITGDIKSHRPYVKLNILWQCYCECALSEYVHTHGWWMCTIKYSKMKSVS